MRKIDFSQKNQNSFTYMYHKNSKSLENNIDNSSIQIFIFSLRLIFVFKEKKFPRCKISYSPYWGKYPLPLNAIWKTLSVVTNEQNFVEHS